MLDEIKDVRASIWISASAGTGKTKSLIDRILALLLNGANPEKILCLTYTDAAAAEMSTRLTKVIHKLKLNKLPEINKEFPQVNEKLIDDLFAKSLSDSWVKIQTIHSFCFSILSQFPMETGFLSGIKLCDDFKRDELLKRAYHETISARAMQPHLKTISGYMNDFLIYAQSYTQVELMHFFASTQNFRDKFSEIYQINLDELDLPEKEINQKLCSEFFGFYYQALFRELAVKWKNTSSRNKEKWAGKLLESAQNFDVNFLDVFLTEEGKIKQTLYPKNSDPDFCAKVEKAAQNAKLFFDKKKCIEAAQVNISFFTLLNDLITNFQAQKKLYNYIDHNDTILQASLLLKNFDWVMYKTDSRIQHLLLDEAQDTNPEQWTVINQITSDFFSNFGSEKTIFIVGDEKQSIYSFQGADVELFRRQKRNFKQLATACGQKFHEVSLNKSYRTTANILRFVDNVFANATDFPFVQHTTNRIDGPDSVVKIIDPFCDDDKDMETFSGKAEFKLAQHLAQDIKRILDDHTFVPSKNRAAVPSDFMILFRSRKLDMMETITDQLKKRHIPTAGIDKVVLKNELIVEDLICFAEFSLFPPDDLMCTRVLRSPIVGISAQELQEICLDRGEQRLYKFIQNKPYSGFLNEYVQLAPFSTAYDFFTKMLNGGGKEKFISRLGDKCLNSLYEFLDKILQFQSENTPSLANFVKWFKSSDHEFKKDPFGAADGVKLATVHGSKGLQAPFVILADTHFLNNTKDKILTLDNGDKIFNLNCALAPQRVRNAYDEAKNALKTESKNLLYVAMTRAEDFLHIYAKKLKKDLPEDCWYQILKSKLDDTFVDCNGIEHVSGSYIVDHQGAKNCSDLSSKNKFVVLPDWFTKKLDLPQATQTFQPREIIYGNYVHELLSKPNENFENIPADDLTTEEINSARLEVRQVIEKFPNFFEPEKSFGEIPFVYEGKSGRIDRLVFDNDNSIWIVDFKSGVPEDPIPNTYLQQLKFYRDFVRQAVSNLTSTTPLFKNFDVVSTNAKINAAILWTKSLQLCRIF